MGHGAYTQSFVLLLRVPSIVGEDEEWRGWGMERMVVVGPRLLLTSGAPGAAQRLPAAGAAAFFSGESSGCELE